MTHAALGGLDWSVRYGTPSTYTERVTTDTLEGAADLLARQLPASAGYEVRRVRLSGSLRGASFRVRRGSFTASVSVQTFPSPGRSAAEGDGFALRMVARSQPRETALATVPPRNGLRLTGGAAASMGIGALALAISGSLTAWATAVLLIPALFATRLCMTLWIADTLGRRGQETSGLPTETASAIDVRDRRRWQRVLGGLEQLHENAAERLTLQQFRGISSAPAPLALGPAPALRSTG